MSPCLPSKPQEIWLVCPGTVEQIDAYWQVVSVCRCAGIELVLHPLQGQAELPRSCWSKLKSWQGLVLWPDEAGQRLRRVARLKGIRVRCLSLQAGAGVQPWSAGF